MKLELSKALSWTIKLGYLSAFTTAYLQAPSVKVVALDKVE